MADLRMREEGPDGGDEKLFKIIVCGDYAVGKTSLIARYCDGVFSPNYKLTIGVDFSVKQLNWDDQTSVSLQIWDIAGHERFGCMTHAYYKHCIAAVIVFDVTRPTTFDSVIKWKRDINSKVVLANEEPVPTLLLANKADMAGAIEEDIINEFCKQNGFIGWYATSAKAGSGIEDAFHFLTERILEVAKTNVPIHMPNKNTVRLTNDHHASGRDGGGGSSGQGGGSTSGGGRGGRRQKEDNPCCS